MNYEIHFTDGAKRDIRRAYEYYQYDISEQSIADRFLDEVDKQISSLSIFPYRRSLVDDSYLSSRQVRFINIWKYLAFYVINEERQEVIVVRILSSRSDWISILKSNECYFVSEKKLSGSY